MKNNFRFDKLIKGSTGKQLAIAVAASVLVILALWGISVVFHQGIDAENILGLFLDPGNFGSDAGGGHAVFRLIVTLVGVMMFSALTVSILTNAFDQTNENIERGNRRYSFKDHVLILGSGDQLEELLNLHRGRRIVIVSLSQPRFDIGNAIYYRADRTDKNALKQCCADRAGIIYIIGDDNEKGHDAKNIECLDYLREITDASKETKRIDCFVTMDNFSSTEVYQITRQTSPGERKGQSGRLLLVDVINEREYRAEQFLAEGKFFPIITEESRQRAHIIVVGTGEAAQAVIYTIAHTCHYPDMDGKTRKTFITVMDENVVAFRDHLISSRPYLFDVSVYRTVYPDGRIETHIPDMDHLDIEWQFIASSPVLGRGRQMIANWVSDKAFDCRFVICDADIDRNVNYALHLHEDVYDKYHTPVAVYLEYDKGVVCKAMDAARYKNISVFGTFTSENPVGLTTRSVRGRRVNYVYQTAYKKPEELKSVDDEWYGLEECDKYSSIYCSLALPLRRECFGDCDRMKVYEAEHRRWMISQYLMGFRYGEKKDKTLLTHPDLIPFNNLPESERLKDKILIDNMGYILGDTDKITL